MPNDYYSSNSDSRTTTSMVYDPVQRKWVEQTVSSGSTKEGVSVSSGSSTSSPVPTPQAATSEPTKADTQSKADKEYNEMVYNTLEGDLSVVPSDTTMAVKVNDTIYLGGFGKYLSGNYFVSSIERVLDSSGFSLTFKVIKTGFGDSLKSSSVPDDSSSRLPEVDKSTPGFNIGDKVKIVGSDAVYSNANDGDKVPEWVKSKTLTVSNVSSDGTRVLLKEIFSWTYTKFVQRV